MATKTITIDLAAYRRLKDVQKDGESFSQTIKRVIRPPADLRAWADELARDPMTKAAADAVEEVMRARANPTRRRR